MKEPVKREKIGATQGDNKNQRRALLGAISGAGVIGAAKLPGQWTRPVVDHVLLPAHAATTDDTGSSPTGGTTVASTFITTVTSNCAVTCTSAYGLYGWQTALYETVSNSVLVTMCTTYSVLHCSDSYGGFSTSGGSSFSTTFYTGSNFATYATDLTYCNMTVFSSNHVCNVTMTSS